MSSSTTIHGASIRSAKASLAAADKATIAVSQAHTGTARTSERAGEPSAALTAKADLAERRRDRLRVVETDLRRPLCDALQERLADGRAAGGLLERADVEVGDAVEPVLALRVRPGRGAVRR